MPFYDLHVHTNLSIGENTLEEMVGIAKRLGMHGLGVVQYYPGEISEMPKLDIDIVKCVMIKPGTPNELNELAAKVRNRAEVLMVHGGDYDINRAACENSMIDVLCHPELGRKDSGLDHICAKAANENEVAIEINFREILESYKKNRVYVLSAMKKNIKLCKKYGVNVATASGAVTKWGLRSGRELSAVANLLGLELGNAIQSTSDIPENIITKNREKLAGQRWQGVSVVE
jgi:ribonuclease P/MRP protein subunit RPP1